MKLAHIEHKTNKLLGWYADDIHGILIEPVYEKKVTQKELKDEDGNIIQNEMTENTLVKDGYYDISKIPTPNIEVTEEVWQEAINTNANCYENGKFIVKDFRTNQEIETQRIASIKVKASEVINSKYPLYKQLNITNLLDGYTNDDKTKMIDFINSIRAVSIKAELEGTELDSIDWGRIK